MFFSLQIKNAGGDRFQVSFGPKDATTNLYGVSLQAGDQSSCGRGLTPEVCVLDQSELVNLLENQIPGRYTVQYAINTFGDYTMNVTLDGIHVKGSPFTLQVRTCPSS